MATRSAQLTGAVGAALAAGLHLGTNFQVVSQLLTQVGWEAQLGGLAFEARGAQVAFGVEQQLGHFTIYRESFGGGASGRGAQRLAARFEAG